MGKKKLFLSSKRAHLSIDARFECLPRFDSIPSYQCAIVILSHCLNINASLHFIRKVDTDSGGNQVAPWDGFEEDGFHLFEEKST